MLEIRNITKTYPGISAVDGVSLTIQPEEILALVGPSGCGKTTLMRIIAGLEIPDQGEVWWKGSLIDDTPTHRRNFGLMFQDYALFPHMNVGQNIRFGLEMQGGNNPDMTSRTDELLELVGLPGFADRDSAQLSGGEQQRVALARSLAPKPRLLMLDEPLGALDRALRERLQIDLHRILKQARQTTLYVTHDQEEAFSLADRVAVMDKGKIVQMGTPRQIYQQPASAFVAKFIGFDNLFSAEPGSAESAASTLLGEIPIPTPLTAPATLLLRPDRISIGSQGPLVLQGIVSSSAFRGSLLHIKLQIGLAEVEVHTASHDQHFSIGETISISFDPTEAVQILYS